MTTENPAGLREVRDKVAGLSHSGTVWTGDPLLNRKDVLAILDAALAATEPGLDVLRDIEDAMLAIANLPLTKERGDALLAVIRRALAATEPGLDVEVWNAAINNAMREISDMRGNGRGHVRRTDVLARLASTRHAAARLTGQEGT